MIYCFFLFLPYALKVYLLGIRWYDRAGYDKDLLCFSFTLKPFFYWASIFILNHSLLVTTITCRSKIALRACAHQKKFGEKKAGEIESEKGHTCIPMEVRIQKARLARVTAGSKARRIVSRAGAAGRVIPEATRRGYAHLPAINVYKRLTLWESQ